MMKEDRVPRSPFIIHNSAFVSMTFLNPPMLAGVAAALLPLVIHLLNRSRYRNVDWAAMMFLDAMEPRADHTAQLKQWGLLAMRCGALGLLAFALARPILYARGL